MSLRAFMLSSLALLSACGSAPASGSSTTPSTASSEVFSLADAIDLGAAAHPNATPFVVERDDVDGRPVLEVKLLEGSNVYVMKFALDDRSLVSEETKPIEEGELEEYALLAAEIATRSAPLHAGLRMMIEAYGEDALEEVELEMHGVTMVLEAAVTRDGERQVQVHDPDTGAFVMTESH
jgi:hypothetical protein